MKHDHLRKLYPNHLILAPVVLRPISTTPSTEVLSFGTET